jgi:hypothetical protein
MGQNVEWKKVDWDKTLNSKKRRMEKILNGKIAEWTKRRMEKRRIGQNVEWKTLKIKNLYIVEWKKRRMGQNVEWKTYIED